MAAHFDSKTTPEPIMAEPLITESRNVVISQILRLVAALGDSYLGRIPLAPESARAASAACEASDSPWTGPSGLMPCGVRIDIGAYQFSITRVAAERFLVGSSQIGLLMAIGPTKCCECDIYFGPQDQSSDEKAHADLLWWEEDIALAPDATLKFAPPPRIASGKHGWGECMFYIAQEECIESATEKIDSAAGAKLKTGSATEKIDSATGAKLKTE